MMMIDRSNVLCLLEASTNSNNQASFKLIASPCLFYGLSTSMEEPKENIVAVNVVQDYQKYSSLFVFAGGNKAGMEAMDKAKQAEVIYEMSKNSAFFKRAAKLDEESNARAEVLRRGFEEVKGKTLERAYNIAQSKMLEHERIRRFNRICCVLDMDMFYAAVEIRDQPHLQDLPVAVGGDNMISTSNYVARKYGVRAAMPGFIARKLCPNLVFVNCNFPKYEIVAEQIRSIIGEYDPDFSSHSLDEVYFDLTTAAEDRLQLPAEDQRSHAQILQLRSTAYDILNEIRQRIKEATGGLTSSAGMANNFFLAKICADQNKPDGQFELQPTRDDVLAFLTNLPTRKVGGIGKVMEKILDKLGMKTMGNVKANIPYILHAFTPSSSEFLLRVSLGIASEEGEEKLKAVPAGAVTRKSIGCERTYSAKGISDPNELFIKLHEICTSLSEDMIREDLKGRAVTVKVKDVTFNLHTRCHTSRSLVQSTESIEAIAKTILTSFFPIKIRLLGVSVSKFLNQYDEQINESRGQQSLTSFLVNTNNQDKDSTMINSSASNSRMTVISIDDEEEQESAQNWGSEAQPIDLLDSDYCHKEIPPCSTSKQSSSLFDLVHQAADSSSSSSSSVAHQQPSEVICPICNCCLGSSSKNTIAINDHIDKCLSSSTSSGKRKSAPDSSTRASISKFFKK